MNAHTCSHDCWGPLRSPATRASWFQFFLSKLRGIAAALGRSCARNGRCGATLARKFGQASVRGITSCASRANPTSSSAVLRVHMPVRVCRAFRSHRWPRLERTGNTSDQQPVISSPTGSRAQHIWAAERATHRRVTFSGICEQLL